MGNSFGARRRSAKVMRLDGTSFRCKTPVTAASVLADHPGFQLLDADEFRLIGLRAAPLNAGAPLKPGRLYFLLELPRPRRTPPPPDRAWSGALRVAARERLESLMLARRSCSDLSASADVEMRSPGGGVRVRMLLPKAEVARLVGESRDAAEVAEKIVELCVGPDGPRSAPWTPERTPRFVMTATPDRVSAEWTTPERSPKGFAETPVSERSPALRRTPGRFSKTPERWPAMARSPVMASPAGQMKEKRTRFVELPEEIAA